MASAQGSIRVCVDSAALTFKVAGRATMQFGPAFLRRAEQAMDAGVGAIRVDLRDCAYMDSTFLGSLLAIKRNLAARGTGKFALISPSDACKRLLEQMGLHAFLPVGDANTPEPAGPWTDLEDEGGGSGGDKASAVQETVVRAHQELADTPAPGCEQFKSIASKLAAAWAQQKGKQG